MQLTEKIYVAGHSGMSGSALVRHLKKLGYCNLILRNSRELDLRNQKSVNDFFQRARPDYVFLAAERTGGLMANNMYRAQFIYDNLMIQSNIIHHAHKQNIKKLLLLSSSCVYPGNCTGPIREEEFMTGPLASGVESYALAKIAGMRMCDAYREQYGCNFFSVIPASVYGPNDHYDPYTANVLPAMLRKFNEASVCGKDEVVLWGSGTPKRDLMHVDDLASACVHLMKTFNGPGFVNAATGIGTTVQELANLIRNMTGYDGNIRFDNEMPEGAPNKLLDASKLHALGWNHRIGLAEGLQLTYADFKKNNHSLFKPRPSHSASGVLKATL